MDDSVIEFANHASVRIASGDVAVLSDPWYFGHVV